MQPSPSNQQIPFNPEDYKWTGLTTEKIQEIKEAFDLFDEDKGGTIDPKELKDAINGLGMTIDQDMLFTMIDSVDADQSGAIDFSEFLGLMTAKQHEDSREDISKVFALFADEKDKNYITKESLAKKAKTFGSSYSDDQEMNDMIERADSDNDGKVTLDDFYRIMTNKTY